MDVSALGSEERQAIEQILGYLNFSSGASDPTFLAQWCGLCAKAEPHSSELALDVAAGWLRSSVDVLEGSTAAFSELSQARSVLALVFDHCLPKYIEFHRDLLFHQTRATLFRPLLVGRFFESVLAAGSPWSQVDRIVSTVLNGLDDYVGHRPVATLETQKHEPYRHEWVRPIPIYVRGAGIAAGDYQAIIERSLEILARTPEPILRQARFDPDCLDELAVDPRAYDFDHPVNKRPNYHFGQWDPHHIDGQGRYRRFVLQEVTLSSLLRRIQTTNRTNKAELEVEAAVVLAGTILMASGTSGEGPNAFDSTQLLADLLVVIANFRDAFYDEMLNSIGGRHGDRLRREAIRRKQAFGGARQHLNAELARRRALQLEHLQLARIYAAMGYPEAAARQAEVVQAASARIHCQIECLLTEGQRLAQAGNLSAASGQLPRVMDLVQRGIQCGAIVDPWNILAFDAHFDLFMSTDSNVYDHRVDDLVILVEHWFAFCANLWSESAARNDTSVATDVEREFRSAVSWWRQYAAHECSSVKSPDPEGDFRGGQLVAEALGMWHRGGAAAGDVAFWAPHAKLFPSPEAYALVIEALLARRDFVASMALLMHWLSESDHIPLMQGENSFLRLATGWLGELAEHGPADDDEGAENRWRSARRFFDFLEANAEAHWRVPDFELGSARRSEPSAPGSADNEEEEEEENSETHDGKDLFGAAYEEMVYVDETDDGVDSPIFEMGGVESDDEFEREARRLIERLSFLRCVARLWKVAGIHVGFRLRRPESIAAKAEYLARWSVQAAGNRDQLIVLLDRIRAYRLPTPSGDHDSMVEYDRRRTTKDTLLEHAIAAAVDMGDATIWLSAAAGGHAAAPEDRGPRDESRAVEEALSALLMGDAMGVRERWQSLEVAFRDKSLLYVPVTKGGDPRKIVAARARRRMIQDLLTWLPRAGLLIESCRLIEISRSMDRVNTVGAGAVTEFDELFTLGYRSLVDSILASFSSLPASRRGMVQRGRREQLMLCLESLTESMLISWLAHSQTLRLSVLEFLYDEPIWGEVVDFIKRHGRELFTQRFLGLGNIRAILHEGVDQWLAQLAQHPHVSLRLLDEIDEKVPREKATRFLTLVLDAIVENYAEYRDYNSTTTQSDRGDMLYALLDFLRLLSRYERICWNLRPVVLAHELLVRRGFADAARNWRQELTKRIGEKASEFVMELRKMQRKYAIQMPTVADRVQERFVQPLLIDRIRALVEPAMRQASLTDPAAQIAFPLLERDADLMAREPSGAGLDVPSWLEGLEEEVDRVRRPAHSRDDEEVLRNMLPQTQLGPQQILSQLHAWSDELGRSKGTLRLRWSD